MRTQPLDWMPPLLPSSPRPPTMVCSIRVGRRSSCGRGDRLALWMPAVHFPAQSPPWSRGLGWGFSSCPSRALASSSSAPKSYATWSKNQVQDEEEKWKRSSCPEGLQSGSLPQHVAVIMDGNSRWARRRGLPVAAGHEAGVRALQEVVRLSCAWGIPILTVFAFSMDNWNRPQKLVSEVVEMTKANHRLKLVVAVSYSGRNEIVRACQKLASRARDGELWPADITESMFERELDMRLEGGYPDPDLVIRTSGELRLSNFFLWQLAYSELFFTKTCWPDFGEAEYAEALLSYQTRQRRFGRRDDEMRGRRFLKQKDESGSVAQGGYLNELQGDDVC
ncbi:Dehydrodolichyl diphosphate synthase 2 [Nymphaea thermarum]|nr:Dehydrodolichyl diphosphate synthase 2 [Nymphaea thermarum]